MKVLSKQGKWAKVALSSGTCGFVYRLLLAPGSGSAKPAAAARSSQPSEGTHSVIQLAMACRGTHYVRGGTSRGGFDCSGFTRYVYAKYGIMLPHSSAAQAGRGTAVSRSELKPGDLVFFQTYRRGISHVGIYIGNGNFVHAASRGSGVRVDSLDSSYYAPRYRGARRVG
jgi:cell wall-associated NlpC family hydrolase